MNQVWSFLKKNKFRNGARIFFFLLFVGGIVVPSIYTYRLEIPSISERHMTEGVATFKYAKRGRLLSVNGIDLSCGYEMPIMPDCFGGKERGKSIAGKTIAVEWFPAKTWLFLYENKVISIASEEGVIRSEADSRKFMEKAKDRVWPKVTIMFFVLSGMLLVFEWQMKRGDKK